MAKLDAYLMRMKDMGASDLHLMAGAPAKVRVHGELDAIPGEQVLTQSFLATLLLEIIDPAQKTEFNRSHDLDFAYGLEGIARFRCNYCFHKGGVGAVFRIIPEKVRSLTELNLPSAIEKLAHLHSGLVLITGPTGSGKSTTLAAIIDVINSTYEKHILTIEDPIEFVHMNKRCLITQREIGHDTKEFANALRAACREDADVVLVGEMRDLETISLALSIAEMGQLVFGTLHTNNATRTIDRIVDVFPADQQGQVRIMLSDSLKGIVAQQLLRTKDGKGRVGVVEILFGSPALSNIIREAKTQQIPSLIQAGKIEGMQSMDTALLDLVKKGTITAEEAYWKAQDKKLFESLMKTP
ncbi:type IV pilus twitching motility protein PilT [bacterium]|nr:type IV pilus twitching motility protein PilT [bacterium]MCI0601416.1 type IV pilus twitching motility protein PilT [bacterium]